MKRVLLQAVLLSAALLVTCSGCSLPALPGLAGTPTSTPAATAAAASNTPGPTQAVDIPPTPVQTVIDRLVIWVPPQFDPNATTQSAYIFRQRLQEFSNSHNGLPIDVRVKAANGPSGLLDSLTVTSAAAPRGLPDLVALSRADLEMAAVKGLISPMDGITHVQDDPDWYAYARQLSLLQGSTYGLPFAGDALVLLYRSAQVSARPKDWAGMLRQTGVIAFPAADPQALFVLTLYQAAGGQVSDSQGRPVINPDVLANVLTLLLNGVKSGQFPAWLAQSETDSQAWQVYREQRATWVVTWASHFLAELPADTNLIAFPAIGQFQAAVDSTVPLAQPTPTPKNQPTPASTPTLETGPNQTPFTLANGWTWSLATTAPERLALAGELAEFLVESGYQSRWTASAGFLPTRPTSLAGWTNQSLRAELSQVVLSAQARPTNDLLVSLSPLLREALLNVIKGTKDPTQAAQAVADALKGP